MQTPPFSDAYLDSLYPFTDAEILARFSRSNPDRPTENEYRCLFLRTNGWDDTMIAQELDIKLSSVPTLRQRARDKLHISGLPKPAQEPILNRKVHFVMRYISEHRGEYYPYVAGQDVVFTIIDPRDGTEIRLWKPATPDEIYNEKMQGSPLPFIILFSVLMLCVAVAFANSGRSSTSDPLVQFFESIFRFIYSQFS